MRLLNLLPIIALLTACVSSQENETRVRPVKVTIATKAQYLDKDFAGVATSENEASLAFKVSGQILSVDVTTGQSVFRGQLLCRLDPRDYELQLAANLSTYQQSKSRLDRMKRLIKHEAVSKQEYEAAEAEYVRAKSDYENSVEMVEQTRLVAPFAAVIERIDVLPYETVSTGQTILFLVNPKSRNVEFAAPENMLQDVENDSTLYSVTFDNYPKVAFDAMVVDYAKTSAQAAGFPVTLLISDSKIDKYSIAPGISCTVTMRIEEPNKGFVSLPLTAIYAPAEGGTYVWVVDDNGKVKLHEVTLGEIFGRDRVIVRSGIEVGDKVVIAGVYKLQNNDRVKILE